MRKRPRGDWRRLVLAVSAAALLSLAFPSFDCWWGAWVALIPWLRLLDGASGRAAFRWSWLIGFLFFLGSIWWLTYVTIVGWLILCAYLALYFGAFGWFVCWCEGGKWRVESGKRDVQSGGVWSHVRLLLFVPAAWVALEYARSTLLSGFGWNLLGYSQTPWTLLIQQADLSGVWGVSFLIVFVNAALAAALRPGAPLPRRLMPAVVAGLAMLAALGYGWVRVAALIGSETFRVAVVQGNIPQEQKWDPAFESQILARYEALTQEAARTQPDLIVWPETAVPTYLGIDEEPTQRVFALASTIGRPLLVGSPMATIKDATVLVTNAAALIDPAGAIADRYDKLHLVPFGEFIPGEAFLPWLRNVLPPIGDFIPGRRPTVFTIHDRSPFSVLICFEDVFPSLARRFVQAGAHALLVITNDAWFGPTGAAAQHLQASVFRAVELRVPVARAANTGWSGCIDPAGRILGSVRDAQGRELFVDGSVTCDLPLAASDTLLTRWGDWFAWLCCLLTAAAAGVALASRRPV